jgi:hypothetical protein
MPIDLHEWNFIQCINFNLDDIMSWILFALLSRFQIRIKIIGIIKQTAMFFQNYRTVGWHFCGVRFKAIQKHNVSLSDIVFARPNIEFEFHRVLTNSWQGNIIVNGVCQYWMATKSQGRIEEEKSLLWYTCDNIALLLIVIMHSKISSIM